MLNAISHMSARLRLRVECSELFDLHSNVLKSLEDLAVDGTRGVDVFGRAGATVLGGTVCLTETANTDGLSHYRLIELVDILSGV